MSHNALWTLIEPTLEAFLDIFYEVRYKGTLPEGPCVILPKHQRFLDIPVDGCFAYRKRGPAHFIMREFPFPLHQILKMCGTIHVVRGEDHARGKYTKEAAQKINENAINTAIDLLGKGEVVINYVEGKRTFKKMRPIHIRPKSTLYGIINAQKEIGKVAFVAMGNEYNGRNITVRAGNPFYTTSSSELENYLSKELPKLSRI